TPSARAISLCNFPCIANSFACASLVAISALECLFLLTIVVPLRPPCCIRPPHVDTNFTPRCLKQRVVPGSGTRNKCSGSAPKKQPPPATTCQAARLTWVMCDGCVGTECESICGTTLANCKWVITVCHPSRNGTIQLTAQ